MKYLDKLFDALDKVILHPVFLGGMMFSFALVLSYIIIHWYVTPYFMRDW
tara:strand:+ start:1565 stop:1714 length:150 start_codon:yes stop_codon:yes gene_type:complete